MATSVTATVDFSGPFFQRDPQKTIMENVTKMMQGLADEGAVAARQGLSSGSSDRAPIYAIGGRVADHVVGRVASRRGRRWTASAVVQVYDEGMDMRDAVSLMAAASVVERRTRAIRNVTRQLRGARAVLRANLTDGLE